MKKILLIGCFLLVSSPVWAFGQSVLTADGQVKATAGNVYEVIVSFKGVTAGDQVQIKNSLDNSGTAILHAVASAANGTIVIPTPAAGPVRFFTAIYCDVTLTGGSVQVTTLYE